MGQKGSLGSARSIRFPLWMAEAIDGIAKNGGHTFTDVVLELLRKELEVEGYSMGIGRKTTVQDLIDEKKMEDIIASA